MRKVGSRSTNEELVGEIEREKGRINIGKGYGVFFFKGRADDTTFVFFLLCLVLGGMASSLCFFERRGEIYWAAMYISRPLVGCLLLVTRFATICAASSIGMLGEDVNGDLSWYEGALPQTLDSFDHQLREPPISM